MKCLAISAMILVIVLGNSAAVSQAPSASIPATRLWDRQPPLREIAREVRLENHLSPNNPEPEGYVLFHPPSNTPNLSNREIKIGLWGPPEQVTLSLKKTDSYDRSKDIAGPVYARAKPTGQIIFRCPELAGAPQPLATTSCADGLTTLDITRGPVTATLRYLVSMGREDDGGIENVIAIDANLAGTTKPVTIRLYRHQDTMGDLPAPVAGKEGGFFWLRQDFPPDKTFPKGFSSWTVGTIAGQQSDVTLADGEVGLGTPICDYCSLVPPAEKIRYAKGAAATATPAHAGQLTALITVVTTAEAPDPFSEAKRRLLAAEKLGFEGLRKQNQDWFTRLYDRREYGRIFSENVADTKRILPALFRSWTYAHTLNTDPDPVKFEADAWGYNYIEPDDSGWYGLSCFNEMYFVPESVANRTDRRWHSMRILAHWQQAGRLFAKEAFGMPGGLIVHGYLPPITGDRLTGASFRYKYAFSTAAMLVKTAWDAWDYDGRDDRFLRENVYPYLKDLAVFFAAYAKKGDDGRYHLDPAMAGEVRLGSDAIDALAAATWTLERAATAAERLGIDEEQRVQWRVIARAMAPYPMLATPNGKVFLSLPGLTEQEQHKLLATNGMNIPICIFDAITLDSPPDIIATYRRTGELFADDNTESLQIGYHLLGLDPEIFYPWRQTHTWFYAYSSLRPPGTTIGTLLQKGLLLNTPQRCADVFWLEPDRLVNSRSGRIHLFACMPKNATVAFRDLQARGGFLISGEMVNGAMTLVQITSRRSGPCRLVLPWGHIAVVTRKRDNARIHINIDGDDGIVFTTDAGTEYTITP